MIGNLNLIWGKNFFEKVNKRYFLTKFSEILRGFLCWSPKSLRSCLNSVRVSIREFPTKFSLCGRLLTESDKDWTFDRIEPGIPRSKRESGNFGFEQKQGALPDESL